MMILSGQMLRVDSWSPGVPMELYLSPTHSVRVRLMGLLADDAGVRFTLTAQRTAGSVEPVCFEKDHSTMCCFFNGNWEGSSADLSSRRYDFFLPAGRYRVSGQSLLYDIDEAEIDVPENGEPMEFEVTARPVQ